jgi:outer membrane protein assembly factor BamB
LVAYDLEGSLIWKKDLGRIASQHGAAHSPMVYAGKVYLANDQDGSAVLLAFDAKSGQTSWRVERKAFRSCYSTPFIHQTADGLDLVVASTAGITAYDPETGNVHWNCDWPFDRKPLRTVASPVEGAGLIFANAGDGDGSRDLIAVRPGKKGVKDGEIVWQERKSFPYVPTLLTYGKYLFSVNDAGIAACHVAATGERVWNERLGSSMTASPVLIDGKVYAAGDDGQVYIFAAAPTFKLLGKSSIGEPILATPAVADGKLYLRSKEYLYCVASNAKKQVSSHGQTKLRSRDGQQHD